MIELHAKKKEQMDAMRKEREAARFAGKLDQRQRMIDLQVAELNKIQNKEHEILEKQINEADSKARAAFESQERRKVQLKG
jgi:predicted transposase YbfD/YdcC